jgi:hypothetical protein
MAKHVQKIIAFYPNHKNLAHGVDNESKAITINEK